MYPIYALQVYHAASKSWVDTAEPAPHNRPHYYNFLESVFSYRVRLARERQAGVPVGFRVVVKWQPPKVGAVYNLWTNGKVPSAGENLCIP